MASAYTVAEFRKFVEETAMGGRPVTGAPDERLRIAVYGFSAQVGLMVSELVRLLRNKAENSDAKFVIQVESIEKVIGDVFWYHTWLQILADEYSVGEPVPIVQACSEKVLGFLDNERIQKEFEGLLSPSAADLFRRRKRERDWSDEQVTWDDAADLLRLTARSADKQLLEVCAIRLTQAATQILTIVMPELERTFSETVKQAELDQFGIHALAKLSDLPQLLALSFWHLVVVAGEMLNTMAPDQASSERSLGFVLQNSKKRNRFVLNDYTELPFDKHWKQDGRLPEKMNVAFIATSEQHALMFYEGNELGDELTDNSYTDDGYRFHDVLHLSNSAYLGWSPVLRSLLGRKRKKDKVDEAAAAESGIQFDKTDQVEDGARARIVEELILKYFHSEASRGVEETVKDEERTRSFPTVASISSGILSNARFFASGLEVHELEEARWAQAVKGGFNLYSQLRHHIGGMVLIDRSCSDPANRLSFEPFIGTYLHQPVLHKTEVVLIPSFENLSPRDSFLRAVKVGICKSINVDPSDEILDSMEVRGLSAINELKVLDESFDGFVAYSSSCPEVRCQLANARYLGSSEGKAVVGFRVSMAEVADNRCAVIVSSVCSPGRNR